MAVEHALVEVGDSSQSTLVNHLKTTTGTIVSKHLTFGVLITN